MSGWTDECVEEHTSCAPLAVHTQDYRVNSRGMRDGCAQPPEDCSVACARFVATLRNTARRRRKQWNVLARQ
eukprot:351375-Chlamydomonas_euryale.AAC.26